jgi:hypothetical protein
MHHNPTGPPFALGVRVSKIRIQNLMVQKQTLDDGALPHDLARETKVPILMEIGCRKNDKMVVFYTPPLGLLLRIRLGRWPSAHPVGIERTRRQLRPSSRECIAFGLNRT